MTTKSSILAPTVASLNRRFDEALMSEALPAGVQVDEPDMQAMGPAREAAG